MRVFVTGASGHVGSFVVPELRQAGHQVLGLARSDAAAAAVAAMGAEVRRGDLSDPAGLADAVAEVDGVIHLAFNHEFMRTGADGFTTAAQQDLATVQALGDALAGTSKAYIGIGIALSGDPETDAVLEQNPRAAVWGVSAGFAGRDIRSALVAVPPVTHSNRDVVGFIPTLIAIARQTGVSAYVDDGATRWPAAHTSDVARLFRLALERAPAGSQLYGAVEEPGVRVGDIAEAIAGHLGMETASIPPDRAGEHFGPFGQIMLMQFPPMPSEPTRQLLGWEPTGIGLLAEIDAGHYFVPR